MMKRIILTCLAAGLLGLAGLGEEAGTHVQFDFYNAALAPQGARGLAVFPELIDAANPLGLTTHDRIYRSTSAGGSVVISNLVWGDYRVEFYGPTITTTNWFSVPATNTGALLNVTNLIRQAHAWQGRHAATYGPWNLLPGSNVVFSTGPGVTYVNATGDGGWTEATTATGWKLVEPEYAGGTNTFAPVYQLTQGNGIVVNPVTTAVGSGLYTVKTQWMELDREIVVWTNAAGDLITRSPHDEVDDIYVFTSQAGATNFDATTGWPGWGIGWQGLTNSGVLAAKWSWTTNYVLQGWGLNGQVPEDGAVLAWGTGLDYTTNGGVWTVYATNIPARSLGTSNAPAAGKVLTVDAGTNLYWTDLGSASSVNLSNIVWESLEVDANFASITNLDFLNVGLVECASIVAANYIELDSVVRISGLVFATNGIVLGAGATVTGDGSGLTNLPADQLTGTVPLARLSGITSNQIADSTLGTNKLDANAYALLTKTGGGSGTATNLAPDLNATNLTLVKGTNTLAGTDTGWSYTGTLAGDGSGLANVPVPRNAILTNVTLFQDGGAPDSSKIIVTNRTFAGATTNQTTLWFTPSQSDASSFIMFSQDSPRRHAEIHFWPNHSPGLPELIFNCQPGSLGYYYDYIQWGQPSHLGPTYEYWKSSTYSGWLERQSGKTNFWMWPGATWQFEALVRTNTGPNDVVYAGSLGLLSGGNAKKPTMMFRPTSTNGSGAWIFMDDFQANSQSGLFQAVTPWGTNWHKIFRDNTYTERLRITAGPDGGLSFNGRFIVNGKEGLTTNVLAGETRLDITNGVIVGVTLNEVLQLTPRTITNSNASTWGKGAGLICVDANYIYISTGTNTWKRAALGW